jgi:hypothetical protein
MHPSHEVQLQSDLSPSCGGTATEAIVERVCEGLEISKELYNYL